MTSLTLVRGLPGSGKSTVAKRVGGFHIEADMYFVNADGVYLWDANRLHLAHGWCRDKAIELLTDGKDVVVSNTFTTLKELRPYFNMAADFGIVPTVILAQNAFTNVHNVPAESLDKMRARFAYDISELFND